LDKKNVVYQKRIEHGFRGKKTDKHKLRIEWIVRIVRIDMIRVPFLRFPNLIIRQFIGTIT